MASDVQQLPGTPRHESAHELHILELDHEFVPGVRLSDATHRLVDARRQMLADLIGAALGWNLVDGFQILGRLVMVRLEPGLLAVSQRDPADEVLVLLRTVGEIAHITKVANTMRMGEGVHGSKSALEARKTLDRLASVTFAGGRLLDIALFWLERYARVREDICKLSAQGGRSVEVVIPARQQVLAMKKVMPRSPDLPRCMAGNLKVLGRGTLIRTIDSRYLIFPSGLDAKGIRVGPMLRIATGKLGKARKIEVRREPSNPAQRKGA